MLVLDPTPMLRAATSHELLSPIIFLPGTEIHFSLVGRGNPNGPRLFLRQEPPPTVEKQMRPVIASHVSVPQWQGMVFAVDPFVMEQF